MRSCRAWKPELPIRDIKLTSKAKEDLTAIWDYSYRHFGMEQADMYIGRISAVFEVLGTHQVGTPRPELGDSFFALPIEQHVIFFIATAAAITVVRILSQLQDPARHLSWR